MKKELSSFRAEGHGSLSVRRERRPSEAQARISTWNRRERKNLLNHHLGEKRGQTHQ